MKTSIPESPLTPEQTEQLRALVIDYLRDRITAEPATYVGRGRTREALLLEPLEHAQAIVRTWSVGDFLEFLDLESPVYLQSVVDHLGFDPRTGRPCSGPSRCRTTMTR